VESARGAFAWTWPAATATAASSCIAPRGESHERTRADEAYFVCKRRVFAMQDSSSAGLLEEITVA
jgi:hypothetical protein